MPNERQDSESTPRRQPLNRLPDSAQDAALIDIKTVFALTAYKSATTINLLIKDRGFPQPLAAMRYRRWRLRDVRQWLEAQALETVVKKSTKARAPVKKQEA